MELSDAAKANQLLWWITFSQFAILVLAIGLEFYQIEIIIGSGVVYSIIGGVVAVFAQRRKRIWLAAAGWSAPAISLFIFALINLNEWGPAEATEPVQVMSIVYGLVIGSLLVKELLTLPALDERSDSQRHDNFGGFTSVPE